MRNRGLSLIVPLVAIFLSLALSGCEAQDDTSPRSAAMGARPATAADSSAANNTSAPSAEAALHGILGKVVNWKDSPGGWKPIGWTWWGGSCAECESIGISTLSRHEFYALVLTKPQIANNGKDIAGTLVLGGVFLGKTFPRDAEIFSFHCRISPHAGREVLPSNGRYAIFGEAKFDREGCQRYSRDVKRAWHVEIPTGIFTPIAAGGVVCADPLSGVDPTTTHCPAPSKVPLWSESNWWEVKQHGQP